MKTPIELIQEDLESLTEYILNSEFEYFIDHLQENVLMSEEESKRLSEIQQGTPEEIAFVDSFAANRRDEGHIYAQAYRLWGALLKREAPAEQQPCDDQFVCEHCRTVYDIEESIKLGDSYICEHCVKKACHGTSG
jgi:hypothetical protein